MMVYDCSQSIQDTETEDSWDLENSLGYIRTPCLTVSGAGEVHHQLRTLFALFSSWHIHGV